MEGVGQHTTTDSASKQEAGFPAGGGVCRKVLIIGLDGATFDVLDPLMAEGRMPHLKRLVDTGAAGVLMSTMPPITPAAWTTFMTGMGPGKHGILDFERYDPRTHELSFNNMFQLQHKTIWQMLSDRGLKVGSIHLPMTYPPQEVNGFMISGFDTPSENVQFTYPPELKDLILREIPDYNYSTNWRRSLFNGRRMFAENLNYIKRSFDQGVHLAHLCGERYGWDAMMVLFKLVDNLQHKCWQYLDPAKAAGRQDLRRMVVGCFTHLDQCIGQLIELAHENDALIIVMSDHGHGSLDGRAQPNLLLKRWGYLRLTSVVSQAKTRAAYVLSRTLRKKTPRFSQPDQGIERDLAIDWCKTKACVMHAGIYGFLYINLKGRQPQGIVEPGDYERLRDELRQRLLDARDERFGKPIYQAVHKPEQLYNCSRHERDSLPDLLLIPTPGLAVVRKIRGRRAVRWNLSAKLGGTHRVEGVLVLNGQPVKSGYRLEANIADITPTVLACLGVPVPADMEGKALTHAFETDIAVQYEPPGKPQVAAGEDVYTEQEKKVLTQRLADLGYLE